MAPLDEGAQAVKGTAAPRSSCPHLFPVNQGQGLLCAASRVQQEVENLSWGPEFIVHWSLKAKAQSWLATSMVSLRSIMVETENRSP